MNIQYPDLSFIYSYFDRFRPLFWLQATPHLTSKRKSLHGRKLRPKSVVDCVEGISADDIPDLLPSLQSSTEGNSYSKSTTMIDLDPPFKWKMIHTSFQCVSEMWRQQGAKEHYSCARSGRNVIRIVHFKIFLMCI